MLGGKSYTTQEATATHAANAGHYRENVNPETQHNQTPPLFELSAIILAQTEHRSSKNEKTDSVEIGNGLQYSIELSKWEALVGSCGYHKIRGHS